MSRSSITQALCLAAFVVAVSSSFTFWETDPLSKMEAMKAGIHNPYRDFNEFLNEIFYTYIPVGSVRELFKTWDSDSKYYVESYLRDLFAGTLVYWITSGIWHIIIYRIYADELFIKPGRKFPSTETITDQMKLAQCSLLVYAALPVVSEILIENNLTKVYFYVDEVGGWAWYLLYTFLYISLVEVGIYWMHRTLHENKFLYKYVHALHHKYNKALTLTPWASIAFNPIDGMLQASPYVFFLFFVPVHYYTHMILLFFSGVWATNIHDALDFDSEPIMGSKYHTLHHTHYHFNYGQWFIFCDYIFGTLRIPSTANSKSL